MRSIIYTGRCVCVLLAVFFSSHLIAQTRAISGKITDVSGQGVPGVNVLIKGTTNGTSSDANGNYTINVDNENAVLVFSSVGFTPQEKPVGNQSTIAISLQEDISTLNEVVVTGYQTENRREITGAVSTVKAKDIVSIPQGNLEQQLQGRVAGLSVITSGQPGTPSVVRIRGFSSFSGNEPLYIVDGVPTFNIDWLNSNDVETTTVLKDAGAASIFGTRASGGVIVISTKKGTTGKIRVSYDGVYGTQVAGKGFDVLNPSETAYWTWQAKLAAGKVEANGNPSHPQYGNGVNPTLPDFLLVDNRSGLNDGFDLVPFTSKYNVNYDLGGISQVSRANKEGTNWFKEITRPASIQNHRVGISGGSENSRYYVGVGYFDQQGIVKSTYFRRYTLRANTEFTIKSRVRVGENFNISYIDNPRIANLSEGNPISESYRINPIIPVYDINGNYAGTRAGGLNNSRNPVANLARSNNNTGFGLTSFGNVFAEVDIIPNLVIRSSFGGEFNNYYFQNFTPQTYENSENSSSSVAGAGAGYFYSWAFTNTVRYQKTFGVHTLKAIVGYEAIKRNVSRNLGGSGLNPFSNDPLYRNISTSQPTGRQVFESPFPGTRIASFFGRLDYIYNERYIVNLTLRRDQSSLFGPDFRTGIFPAVSAAWRVSSESFMNGLTWVNDLKLRGGYGIMGNDRGIPFTNQFNSFAASAGGANYAATGGGGSTVNAGLRQSQIANPLVRWEQNATANIGIDGTFLNGTLDLIFDIYSKKTTNLLFTPEIPATVGINGYPAVNIASMSNRGIDLQIIKRGKIASDWRYEANVTFTTFRNRILTVTGDSANNFQGPANGSGRIGSFTLNQAGQPLSSYYGYKVTGLFQSDEEVKGAAKQAGAAPGTFRYQDTNNDKEINDKDRVFMGSPIPKFSYGLILTVGYKALELSANFYGIQGAEIVNYTRWFTDFYPSFPGSAIGGNVRNSWTPTNTNTSVPRFLDVSNLSTNGVPNSYYVENGSYLRCQNIKLSYNLPTALLSRVGAEKVTVFAQTINPFTITNYSGLDPQVAGEADTTLGVDTGNYPFVRQFLVGLGFTF
jgi:TonB-dependent starch-binding outer membrane protein SusC